MSMKKVVRLCIKSLLGWSGFHLITNYEYTKFFLYHCLHYPFTLMTEACHNRALNSGIYAIPDFNRWDSCHPGLV